MNFILNNNSLFEADISRAEELLLRVEKEKACCERKEMKWEERKLSHAVQLLEKVIRNRDIFPEQITIRELVERGLFDLEWEGMVRMKPRFFEIVEDMECMDLSGEKDVFTADSERKAHIDLLHEMAGRWWLSSRD